jgi:hypothetical protein
LARLPLAGAVLLVIIVAEIVDRGAEQQLLAIHRSLQAEMSIWTPAVLLGLVIVVGILAAGVVLLAGHVTDPESARRRICQLAPAVSTIVIALLGLSAFDVLQKSLLSALVLCAAAAYLARRAAPSVASELEWPAVRHRLRTVVREPIVLGGFALFALLALQSGLQSTADVVGGQFGPLQLALDLFLLLTSVVEGFLAVGALFVILYPLLPGRTGYLKAICLAAFLTVIWVFGFGSQEQLIGPLVQLLAGRFLYYLCMPLLLGFVLELDSFRASAAGGSGGARGTPLTLTFGSYVKDFRGLAGTAATVVSLVAPGVYAAVAGAPLVATYFDLLDKWAKFSG